jgi:glycosyltransferase involved in cell wall biosynthesis
MMTGLGHLYTFHDLRTTVLRFVSDRLLRIAFKTTKIVFFQNKDDAQVLLDRRLLPVEKVTLVNGSGVNLRQFPLSPLNQQTPLTFLFVGRLLKSKGFYEYCEAVKMVGKKYPGMRYQLLGGHHPNPAKLERQEATQLMKESGVEHLGEVDNVLPYLQEAHVVVLPSYREGTPKALLEALSVGRPVITTTAPGCVETVEDQVNGLLVNVGDPWAIADAMRFFIQHPEHLKPMALASRRLAEAKFDVHKVNEALLKGMGL